MDNSASIFCALSVEDCIAVILARELIVSGFRMVAASAGLVLAADSLPAAGDYRLSFGLRTSATRPYPYRELVVGMRTETCDTAWTDTLVCTLADAQGEPAGSGLSHYQYEFSADTLRLSLRPALRVRIYHLMRLDPLTGVTDVGAALIPL